MTSKTLPRTLDGYAKAAEAMMSPANRAYFLGSAGRGMTAKSNERAFHQATLLPRPLRDLRGGSTALTLLGQNLACPILVAPFAYHRLLDPQAEIATAKGAQAQSVKMILSAQSSTDLRQVRDAAPATDWFQLYWMGSRDGTLALAKRAIAAGYTTLVLTIDAPVQGVRDAEIEAAFQLPPEVSAVNLAGIAHPRFAPLAEGESMVFDRIASIMSDWDDIAWLIGAVTLPVLIKGVLHPDDAARAQQIGAAGIIVSNHGGRVMDGVPATLDVLPAIINAVADGIPVLMDGGIRRGADVLVALAMGAKAVLVGRPAVCGLAVGGAIGVSHVLRLLRDELEIAMVLAGCRTLADITPDLLYRNR
ncbi:MAG: alpha-hydroxy acid oxidase [Sulfitobacter sp.]